MAHADTQQLSIFRETPELVEDILQSAFHTKLVNNVFQSTKRKDPNLSQPPAETTAWSPMVFEKGTQHQPTFI